MISARTKKQLVAFLVITLLGVSYVGAKYVGLQRLFVNTTYTVNAQFSQSGGIFTGAEVDYRGVHVGQVSNMVLTSQGVDVVLAINNGYKNIPADTIARVANRSAVGEQYVNLEPKTDSAPYLANGSTIATPDTVTPVSTTTLLTNLTKLVDSVPKDKLRTVVTELGTAFNGTGPALSQIIDTSTSFIKTANDNFDTTTALIHDANTVLKTQVDETSAIQTFSRDLSLFTDTLAGHDAQLRQLIVSGSATATELRTFLEQNQVDLGRLIGNLVTTGRIVVKHLAGIRQVLVIYPYAVAGGFTVTVPDKPGSNIRDAHFGLVLTQNPPVCTINDPGYHASQQRSAQDRGNKPMDMTAGCQNTSGDITPRGSQFSPRVGVNYRPPVATYDARTGQVTWAGQGASAPSTAWSSDAASFGKDSWKWILLQPAMPQE